MPIIHVPNAALAAATDARVTIEAEYGSFVMVGSLYTAAHHQASGPYAGRHLPGLEQTGRPSPCNDAAIPTLSKEDIVAISHVDLGTIGGCLRTCGEPEARSLFADEFAGFWNLAEYIDVRGAHHLDRDHEWAPSLLAFWSWLKGNRPRFPRNEVVDCSDLIECAGEALTAILVEKDAGLLRAGQEMADAEASLNTDSFVGVAGLSRLVAIREWDSFTNHLYRIPDGRMADAVVADAVVARNTTMGSITVSLADPIEGVSCRAIVQGLWGPEAGGHTGIAGSPRGREMSDRDLAACIAAVIEALS